MVRFGYVIGVLMLAAGAGLGAWGAPYHMLDWGGTLVVSGALLGSAGAILVMLAAVLGQLKRMAPLAVASPVAASDLEPASPPRSEPRVDLPPAEPEVQTPALASPQTQPPLAAGIAAGAVAAGGLATAAASILSSVSARPEEVDGTARPPLDGPDRNALFSRVEDAVRALKGDAAADADRRTEDEPARDDFSDLRADLLAGEETPPRDAEALDPREAEGTQQTDAGESMPAEGRAAADPDVAEPEEDVAAADDPEPVDARPPASDEGVIAAYTVGDVSYTMFADGRIRADSPEGEQMFGDMDELKAHMARRRMAGA